MFSLRDTFLLAATTSNVAYANSGAAGGASLSNAAHIIPASNGIFDIGSETRRWRNLYLSGNAISFGNGVVFDTFNWNYMVNYVIPPKELANPTPRILFDGVAGDHSAFINAGLVYVFGRNDRGQLGLGDTVDRPVPTLLPNINNAVGVACGDGFTVVLRGDKTAVGFGENANGQLCQSNVAVSFSNPVVIPGLSNAVQVSAGFNHVLYLLDNGMVVGAGSDAKGQLGDGLMNTVTSNLSRMILPSAPLGATDSNAPRFVTCGGLHSAVLLNNGSVFMCGDNSNAQCAADPTLSPFFLSPQQVAGAGASNLVRVACGEQHTVAVAFDGRVVGWGRNAEAQLGVGNTTAFFATPQVIITSASAGGGASGLSMRIDAGQLHTVCAMSNGDVRVWGTNDWGQLGRGAATTIATTPQTIVGLSAFNVAAGRKHTMALRNNSIQFPTNQILAWGDDRRGQVGDGQLGNFTVFPAPNLLVRHLPTVISEAYATRQALFTGCMANHSGYIDGDGTAYLFGNNGNGHLGMGTTANSTVPTPSIIGNVRQIACGTVHTILLDSTGAAHAFGNNNNGQLGDGTTNQRFTPQLITTGSVSGRTIVSIACGGNHTILLDSTGAAHAFGNNSFGQLGTGSTATTVSTPFNITAGTVSGRTIVAIACGQLHTILLDSTGAAHAFGYNDFGQLGNGSPAGAVSTPFIITAGSVSGHTIVAVACGGNHTILLDSTGAAHAFGNNSFGQLGDGTINQRTTPVLVNAGTVSGRTIVAVACGSYHTILLDSTGAAHAFGRNSEGQLGNGSPAGAVSTPFIITAGTVSGRTIVAVACGNLHTILLDSTGVAHAFGWNDFGQLGDGTITQRNTPFIITQTIRSFRPRILSNGYAGNHKLLMNRTVSPYNVPTTQIQAYGENGFFQLGNGNSTTQTVPVTLSTVFPAAILAVSNSLSHSAAVTVEGALYLWGRNNSGQCANANTANNITVPTLVSTITSVLDVVCGNEFTLVRRTDDTLWAVGSNGNDRLGIPTVSGSTTTFQQITTVTNIKFMAAGMDHAAAVDGLGVLYVWGSNASGKTGLGTSTGTTSTPTAVSNAAFDGFGISRVAVGDDHTIVLTNEYFVRTFSCGSNQFGQLGRAANFGTTTANPTFQRVILFNDIRANPVNVVCGQSHTILLLSNGTTRMFGNITYGTASVPIWTPQSVVTRALNFNVVNISANRTGTFFEYADRRIAHLESLTQQVRVECGDNHTILLTSAGTAHAFGWNANGQLGNGSTANVVSTPFIITLGSVSGRTIVSIACGGNHTILLDSTGAAHAFGRNDQGQLGNGSTASIVSTPFIITAGSVSGRTIVAIACGNFYTILLDSTGAAHAFGNNSFGQLGNGSSGSSVSTPFNISAGTVSGRTIVAVACGNAHTILLDSTGAAHAFGYNDFGQLGNGSTANSVSTPFNITAGTVSGRTIVAVACGNLHTILLDSTGAAHAFGWNEYGQLGNGSSGSSVSTPFNISAGTVSGRTIVAVACGNAQTILLDSTGAAHAFGWNGSGQLGDGSTTQRATPFNITAGTVSGRTIVTVACGGNHTILLDSTGAAHAFGYNDYGQLGDGSTSQRPTPQLVPGFTTITVARAPILVNFTGQHRCYIVNYTPQTVKALQGLIVSAATDTYINAETMGTTNTITINESLPIVSLCTTAQDKRVFGVVSLSTNNTVTTFNTATDQEILNLNAQGDTRVQINALGEGAMWVCDVNGGFDSGDYITSSSVPGYGMRQIEDILRNYTVAKATMSCDFTAPLKQGFQVRKNVYGQRELDADGNPIWDPITTVDADGNTQQVMTPAYEMRYLLPNGTVITKEEYEAKIQAGESAVRAAFIGCTYHCG